MADNEDPAASWSASCAAEPMLMWPVEWGPKRVMPADHKV